MHGFKRTDKLPRKQRVSRCSFLCYEHRQIKLSLLSLHMASKTSLNQGSKCRRELLICLEQSQSRSEKSISISLRKINLNLAPKKQSQSRSEAQSTQSRSEAQSIRAQYLYPSKLELNLGSISLQSRTQRFRHHEDCNYKTATI